VDQYDLRDLDLPVHHWSRIGCAFDNCFAPFHRRREPLPAIPGKGTEDELAAGFYELGRSFRILKILTIIYLVLTLGYLVFLFLLGGLGILAGLMES
jgi:hypothetical protein